MRAYTEVAAYIRHAERTALVAAIREQFAHEGMRELGARPEGFYFAAGSGRVSVHVLSGNNGWHLLQASPLGAWCEYARDGMRGRFVTLTLGLDAAGFVLCKMDDYPEQYGEVLLECDGKGGAFASGYWVCEQQAGAASSGQSLFFGETLKEGSISPRTQALATLLDESRALWASGPNPDYDDCRGDSEIEIFFRYLVRRLIGISSWDDWPVEQRTTLYFEPRDATGSAFLPIETQSPPPPVHYADGELIKEGDIVLWEAGLSAGRISGFLPFNWQQLPPVVTVYNGKGELAFIDSGQVGTLRLVQRDGGDFDQAAINRLAIAYLQPRAEANDAAAMYAYGTLLMRGTGVDADGPAGFGWLRRAADAGHADAQCMVGMMSRDRQQALRYFRVAAGQGNARAMLHIGAMYQTGDAVAQDMREAEGFYRRARQRGCELAAEYNSLHCYIDSATHTTEPGTDVAWIRARAEEGDAPAQFMMGLWSEYGTHGLPARISEAVRFYGLAAEQDFGPALCNLADKYEHGNGVEQDLQRSYALYSRAALKQVAAATFSIGEMYRDGRGVPQSRRLAIKFLHLAAAQGWRDATSALQAMNVTEKELQKSLSPDRLARFFGWLGK